MTGSLKPFQCSCLSRRKKAMEYTRFGIIWLAPINITAISYGRIILQVSAVTNVMLFVNAGGGKQGCRTLANLSKLSRRLGLSRFFRTLKIHGNQNEGGTSQEGNNGGDKLNVNSPNICRCYQSNLNSELTSLCQCQYGSSGFSRNTLPDLAVHDLHKFSQYSPPSFAPTLKRQTTHATYFTYSLVNLRAISPVSASESQLPSEF